LKRALAPYAAVRTTGLQVQTSDARIHHVPIDADYDTRSKYWIDQLDTNLNTGNGLEIANDIIQRITGERDQHMHTPIIPTNLQTLRAALNELGETDAFIHDAMQLFQLYRTKNPTSGIS
jgi:hypothetical protein